MSKAGDTTGNFSHICFENQSFLIMEQPKSADQLQLYFRNFTEYNVKHVVRVCPEETYEAQDLTSRGIDCHVFPYADGAPPPKDVMEPWLALCEKNTRANKDDKQKSNGPSTIAIHCVAGLGRAPVLVAIALIEGGMDYLKAVEEIRKVRRGAINKPQVDFLKHYEKRARKSTCVCF